MHANSLAASPHVCAMPADFAGQRHRTYVQATATQGILAKCANARATSRIQRPASPHVCAMHGHVSVHMHANSLAASPSPWFFAPSTVSSSGSARMCTVAQVCTCMLMDTCPMPIRPLTARMCFHPPAASHTTATTACPAPPMCGGLRTRNTFVCSKRGVASC